MIEIHPSASISALADIEDSTRGTRIVIGENVVIDAFVKIKPAGGAGDLVIGAATTVNSGCVFYTGNGVHIGRDVAIAANCTFAPVNHEYADGCVVRGTLEPYYVYGGNPLRQIGQRT